MRHVLLMLTLFVFQSAATSYAQHIRIDLDVKNSPLKQIFKEIESKSDFTFFYNDQLIDVNRAVDVQAKNETVGKILDRILTDCSYVIENKNILLLPKNAASSTPKVTQQQATITGTIVDSNREPVIGANVVVKGTGHGTVTDLDGKFVLADVPEKSTLQISYIGYIAQEIKLSNQTHLNIILLEDTKMIEDIVVVGYGTMKRRDITGSVASLSSEKLKDMPVTQIDQSLTGQLAGVQAMSVTGEPGADMLIRVRGIGSITASATPLYVVDGFPVSTLQTLNPSDIETIDVLKDASATAIYGSRGANGVVLITTKRGQEGKTRINLDIYTGWQQTMMRPEFFNSQQQAQYYYDGVRNQNIDNGNDVSLPYTQWPIQVPQTPIDVLEGRNTLNTDALDAVLRSAPQTRYSLSVSGGSKTLKYSVSGEYMDQDGIIIGTDFKRYALNSNFDVMIRPNLALKVNLRNAMTDVSYQRNSDGGGGANWSVIAQATSAMPYYPLYNEDGSYYVSINPDASTALYNPMAIAREVKAKRNRRENVGNFSLNYEITKELSANFMAGVRLTDYKESTFRPNLDAFGNTPAVGSDNTSFGLNWITETTINYEKAFGGHSFKGLLGFTSQKDNDKSASLTSNRYPNNLVETLSAVSGIITDGTSTISEWSLVSYLGRLNYNYLDKYYLTVSLRTDGSSRFGSDNKYGFFPSAGASWRVSDEGFMKDISYLSQLKLKLSYGVTGNNFIGNYDHLATITYLRYILGNTSAQGNAPASLSNPSLTWETQRQLNTGVDVSFLQNRINLTVDYFNSTNSDLLLNVNVPQITGFTTALQNIGEVKNKGWEIVLNTVNLNGDFSWSTDVNFSTFKNKVTKLGPEGDPIISGERSITQIGQPIGMFYGLMVDGIFKSQAEVDAGPVYNPGLADRSRPGDIRFKDISGPDGVPDGIITQDDYTIIGSPYPDFYYGMTNRFSYKNLSLTVSLQGSYGGEIYNGSNVIRLLTRSRSRTLASQINYWKSEADPGDGNTPRPNNQPTGGIRLPNQRYLDSASYLRINNINLSYSFPKTIAHSLFLNSLRVYATATNPFIFTNNTSFNPEVYNTRNALQPGIEYNNYPVAKSYVFGVSIDF